MNLNKSNEAAQLKMENNASNNNIINICLIPDLNVPKADQFTQQLIELSNQLDGLHSSQYKLCAHVDGTDSRLSLAHCTLGHIKINCHQEHLAFLTEKLQTIIGQTYKATMSDIKLMPQFPILTKDDFLAGTLAPNHCDVQWLNVEKDNSLLELQEKIFSATCSEDTTFITSRNEKYQPHFTLWVKKLNDHSTTENPERQKIIRDYAAKMRGLEIPCRVAIGSCGPIGQVTHAQTSVHFLEQLSLK